MKKIETIRFNNFKNRNIGFSLSKKKETLDFMQKYKRTI